MVAFKTNIDILLPLALMTDIDQELPWNIFLMALSRLRTIEEGSTIFQSSTQYGINNRVYQDDFSFKVRFVLKIRHPSKSINDIMYAWQKYSTQTNLMNLLVI